MFNEEIENGGKGSGNWGHVGRKGKIGGSAKTPFGKETEHQKQRRIYGIKLGELARKVKSNINKKDLFNKLKKIDTSYKDKHKDINYLINYYKNNYFNNYYKNKYKTKEDIEKIDKAIEYYRDADNIEKQARIFAEDYDNNYNFDALNKTVKKAYIEKAEKNYKERIAELLKRRKEIQAINK